MSEITKKVNSISAKEVSVGSKIFLFSLGATIGKVVLSNSTIRISDKVSINCHPDFTTIMLVGETGGSVVGYHSGEFVNDKIIVKEEL